MYDTFTLWPILIVVAIVTFVLWLIPVLILGKIKKKLEDIELAVKGETKKPGH